MKGKEKGVCGSDGGDDEVPLRLPVSLGLPVGWARLGGSAKRSKASRAGCAEAIRESKE